MLRNGTEDGTIPKKDPYYVPLKTKIFHSKFSIIKAILSFELKSITDLESKLLTYIGVGSSHLYASFGTF